MVHITSQNSFRRNHVTIHRLVHAHYCLTVWGYTRVFIYFFERILLCWHRMHLFDHVTSEVDYFNNVLLTFLGLERGCCVAVYLNICSKDERKSYGFGTTCLWVIKDRIVIFWWTESEVPLIESTLTNSGGLILTGWLIVLLPCRQLSIYTPLSFVNTEQNGFSAVNGCRQIPKSLLCDYCDDLITSNPYDSSRSVNVLWSEKLCVC